MKTQSILRISALIIVFLISIFMIIGCKKPNQLPTQISDTPKSQPTKLTATPYQTSAAYTARPSMISTSSATPTPLPSPTKTVDHSSFPTLTSLPLLPTLAKNEAETLKMDLLTNNAGCKLPCWWGFTPGKSFWNSADQYFESFTKVDGPFIHEIDHRQDIGYGISFTVNGAEKAFSVHLKENLINNFGIPPETSFYGYKIDQLLQNSGEPEEVWLAPMPDTPGGSWYYLVLYYRSQGIMARYGGPATPSIKLNEKGEAVIKSIHICPTGIGPELWLAPPNSINGVKGNWVLGGTTFTDLLIPIEQATNMNVEEFYKLFVTGDNSTCFDTPSESWR